MNVNYRYHPFKGTLFTFLIVILFTICGKGQTIIGVADYMKVDNIPEYIELEKQWQKIHRQRLKEGVIVGWAAYQIMFKTPEDPYNFITVSWYDSFSKVVKEVGNETIQAVFPDMTKDDVDAFLEKTEGARTRVQSGVFHQLITCANGLDKQGKFYVINEINVKQGKSRDLLKIYDEIYRPLYEEDVRQNNRTVWSLWEKWEGNKKDFQYLSADGYSSLDQIEQVNYLDYFNKIHPDKDVSEISAEVEELRELVSTEMWKLILRAH